MYAIRSYYGGCLRVDGFRRPGDPDRPAYLVITSYSIHYTKLYEERALFTDEKVKESARKMVEVYQNRGFYDAAIATSVREEADGSIRVSFRVAEGDIV